MATKPKLRPWKLLESRKIFGVPPWFEIFRHRVRLPGGRVVDDYHRIRVSDYAVIVAQTIQGKYIVERQYKHGVGRVTLMTPGGFLRRGENPLRAAKRELLEETGYVARHWVNLGRYVADANYVCSHVHIFLATEARKIARPASGDLETMSIELYSARQLTEALRRGQLQAVSVVAALALVLPLDGCGLDCRRLR